MVLAGLIRVAGVFDRAMVASQRRLMPLNDVTARVRAALPDALLALTPSTRVTQLDAALAAFVTQAGLRSAAFTNGEAPVPGPDVVRCVCGDSFVDFTVSDARQAGSELQLALDVYASVLAAVHERDNQCPISERAPAPGRAAGSAEYAQM